MRVYWRQFACYSFMLTLLGVHVVFQYAVVPNAGGLAGSEWAPAETASGPDLALACEQWIGRRSLKVPKGFVGPDPDDSDGGGGYGGGDGGGGGEALLLNHLADSPSLSTPTPPSAHVDDNVRAGVLRGSEGERPGVWPREEVVNGPGLQQRRLPVPRHLTNDIADPEVNSPRGNNNQPSLPHNGATLRPPQGHHMVAVAPHEGRANALPDGTWGGEGGGGRGSDGYQHLQRLEEGEKLNRKYNIDDDAQRKFAQPETAPEQRGVTGGFVMPAPGPASTAHLWGNRYHSNQQDGLVLNGNVPDDTRQMHGVQSHGVAFNNQGSQVRSPGLSPNNGKGGLPGNHRSLSLSGNLYVLGDKPQDSEAGHQGALPRYVDPHGSLSGINNVQQGGNNRLLYEARPPGGQGGVQGVVYNSQAQQLGSQDVLYNPHGHQRAVGVDQGVVPSVQSHGVYRTRDDTTNPHHQRYTFTCANIQLITIKRKLGQGVTKQVYLGVHENRKVAVKMVTRNVIDVLSCMKKLRRETADLSTLPGEKHKCYTLPNMKLMKEILLLNQLDHPNLLKLQGYCVRSEETDSTSLQEHGIVAVYEYGLRFYISNLREWPWQLRVRTAVELADLLEYLNHSPLGSLRISDFKDAHFLLKDGRIKLTDLDDVTSMEPACQPNPGPELDLKGNRAPAKVCGYNLKCVAGICPGYNAMKNLDNFNRLFFSNLLTGDTPETEEHMARLRSRLENLAIDASELRRVLFHFMDIPFLPGYS